MRELKHLKIGVVVDKSQASIPVVCSSFALKVSQEGKYYDNWHMDYKTNSAEKLSTEIE